MQLSKEEIPREISHQQQAVQALNERRRVLDLQAAQFGSLTPPHVVTELASLTEQIQAREIEIANLKSQSAVDQIPVEEVEFHAMLAEEWDMSTGRLKLAQQARLEWARVRLGIPLGRALVMEYVVRVQLAEELFDDLNLNYLPHNYSNHPKPTTLFDFDRLRKAIQLDLPAAVKLFHARLQKVGYPLHRQPVEAQLLDSDSACREEDAALYERFLNEVQALSR